MLITKAIALWLLIFVFAVLNGVFREAVLLPILGKPYGLMLSGLLLSICIIVVAWLFVPRVVHAGQIKPLYLGLLWLLLTLMFELVFGRWIQGRSWSALLEAYTFKNGNIWPVVLVVTFLAPILAARYASKRRAELNSDS